MSSVPGTSSRGPPWPGTLVERNLGLVAALANDGPHDGRACSISPARKRRRPSPSCSPRSARSSATWSESQMAARTVFAKSLRSRQVRSPRSPWSSRTRVSLGPSATPLEVTQSQSYREEQPNFARADRSHFAASVAASPTVGCTRRSPHQETPSSSSPARPPLCTA